MEVIINKGVYDNGLTNYYIMEVNGNCYGQAYLYADDNKSIYLMNLNVSKESRGKGMGTEMQLKREDLGRELGCKYSYLFVTKGSWMRKWYDRRGYRYYSKKDDDKTSIWLRKKL